ncbi:GtrA family protein [Candidatus Agathobaculum pullicola]|uniref:GtrA family protein n=1 Tax=Candidatus Agathobaculum pullicola TaxID=2838426 RepID=UPI003F8F5906
MDKRSTEKKFCAPVPFVSQIVKFGLVGILNNIICLLVYYLVIAIDAKLYLLGNALGFIVSTLNAYFLNSRFVFCPATKKEIPKGSLVKTYLTYMLSLCISTCLLFLLVDIMGIYEKVAPIISLMITVPLNFVLNKLWIYRRHDAK